MTTKEYKFKFSIIMSVYNVQEFIDEAVESVINQDIGFEKNVQIIMVDDGSTDDSGAICDKYAKMYPNNIKVIHKENGGISTARNVGLQHIEGEFVNFMDPDDLLTSNTLSSVYSFFYDHYDEINMVAIPLCYFDAKTGEHPTNKGKFNKGNRIINLKETPTLIHNSAASAFFKYSVAKNMHYAEDLCAMEDAKAIIEVLLLNSRYGAVSDCKYMYRQRSVGSVSLSHGAQTRKNWYTDFINKFSLSVIDYCLEKIKYIPKFVQAVLLYDLHWKIEQEFVPEGVLTDQELIEYRNTLYSVFQYIDDDMIMDSKWYYYEHKALILYKKYQHELSVEKTSNDIKLSIRNHNLRSVSSMCVTKIEQLKIENNCLIFDANTYILPYIYEKFENIQPVLKINDTYVNCEFYDRKRTKHVAGEEIYKNIAFKSTINLNEIDITPEGCVIEIGLFMDDMFVKVKNFKFSDFSAISNHYKNQYCVCENYILSMKMANVFIQPFSKKLQKQKEKAFQKELWKSNQLGERKAVVVRKLYHFLKKFKRKKIYLITDRINKADDNGEAMFEFYNKNKKFVKENKIKHYFVIDKKSEDYKNLKKNRVVQVYSMKHKILHLLADNVLSSHADNFVNKPMYETFECYRDCVVNQNFIFLQHGVTQNDISGWLNKYNKNIKGFVTTAKPETKSLLTYDYYYTEKEVWEKGFARFDRLYKDEKRYITLMPTWRKYLMNGCDEKTGVWRMKQEFTSSEYYQFYNGLINNEKLLKACEENNYTLCFMPHPNIIPHVEVFNKHPQVKFFGLKDKYRDIYAQSDLIISDYSSAIFDFSYLRKPVIYSQFDYESFFGGNHVVIPGYFNYERDGFGEVTKTLEETVDLLIDYMKNDCKLKDKYRERIDNFFAFNDKNNCERIAKRVVELNKEQEK